MYYAEIRNEIHIKMKQEDYDIFSRDLIDHNISVSCFINFIFKPVVIRTIKDKYEPFKYKVGKEDEFKLVYYRDTKTNLAMIADILNENGLSKSDYMRFCLLSPFREKLIKIYLKQKKEG